ncbi:DUF4974 domain-containing protein [Prolixibacteraceae bacterium JC049]|nr:DUF4974 domain-containing protein [Prolixibacteraceae bacterium JC049]
MTRKLKRIKEQTTSSHEELKDLFYWLNSAKGQSEIREELNEEWNSFESDENMEIDSHKMFSYIKSEIRKSPGIWLNITLKRLLPYAAMLVMVLGGLLWLTFSERNGGNNPYNDVYTSFSTANGQRAKLVLPDSTVVWLNSGTTLSYLFNEEKKRDVILNGQAFFQVRKDNERPFTVHANKMDVVVLGTCFDVETYDDDKETSVVLQSGKVRLNYKQRTSKVKVLHPGEMAVLDKVSNSLKVNRTDIQKHISWKNNLLIFKNEPMKKVIADLERWFNVEVTVLDHEVYNSIFTGTVTNESYDEIFQLIEYSCPIDCEIEPNNSTGKIPHITLKSKNMN